MDAWEGFKWVLDWVGRIQLLIKVLLALGLGAAVRALLYSRIPGQWLLPVWLLSSATFLALFAWGFPWFLRRISKEKTSIPAPSRKLSTQPSPSENLPYYAYDKLRPSDPKLELRFVDDRKVSMSKDDYAYFEFINHGQSEARFACMEDFQIGGLGYRVKVLKTGYEIQPDHSSTAIYFEIQKADNQPKLDIFDAFHEEWKALNKPQLDETKILIKLTYQDAVRNLFETRCELVFYPGAYFRNGRALETRNHKFRRVAAAMSPINWSD
jgi:hypothetical protein